MKTEQCREAIEALGPTQHRRRFRPRLSIDVDVEADVTNPDTVKVLSVRIGSGSGLSEITWALPPDVLRDLQARLRWFLDDQEPLDVGAADAVDMEPDA